MRIISGTLGGRVIHSLPGNSTRPAMARTREALFSMLEARGVAWPGSLVLDLFAGSGSLAYEALSRGAEQAVLVENSAQQCRCLARSNVDLGVEGRAVIASQDVGRYLRRNPPIPFNVVFIDPPYRCGLVDSALSFLVSRGWLAPNAFVAAEIEKGNAPAAPDGLWPVTDRLFGQTFLQIWTNNEDSPLPGDI